MKPLSDFVNDFALIFIQLKQNWNCKILLVGTVKYRNTATRDLIVRHSCNIIGIHWYINGLWVDCSIQDVLGTNDLFGNVVVTFYCKLQTAML